MLELSMKNVDLYLCQNIEPFTNEKHDKSEFAVFEIYDDCDTVLNSSEIIKAEDKIYTFVPIS